MQFFNSKKMKEVLEHVNADIGLAVEYLDSWLLYKDHHKKDDEFNFQHCVPPKYYCKFSILTGPGMEEFLNDLNLLENQFGNFDSPIVPLDDFSSSSFSNQNRKYYNTRVSSIATVAPDLKFKYFRFFRTTVLSVGDMNIEDSRDFSFERNKILDCDAIRKTLPINFRDTFTKFIAGVLFDYALNPLPHLTLAMLYLRCICPLYDLKFSKDLWNYDLTFDRETSKYAYTYNSGKNKKTRRLPGYGYDVSRLDVLKFECHMLNHKALPLDMSLEISLDKFMTRFTQYYLMYLFSVLLTLLRKKYGKNVFARPDLYPQYRSINMIPLFMHVMLLGKTIRDAYTCAMKGFYGYDHLVDDISDERNVFYDKSHATFLYSVMRGNRISINRYGENMKSPDNPFNFNSKFLDIVQIMYFEFLEVGDIYLHEFVHHLYTMFALIPRDHTLPLPSRSNIPPFIMKCYGHIEDFLTLFPGPSEPPFSSHDINKVLNDSESSDDFIDLLRRQRDSSEALNNDGLATEPPVASTHVSSVGDVHVVSPTGSLKRKLSDK